MRSISRYHVTNSQIRCFHRTKCAVTRNVVASKSESKEIVQTRANRPTGERAVNDLRGSPFVLARTETGNGTQRDRRIWGNVCREEGNPLRRIAWPLISCGQRKVFTTPLLSEAKSDRNTNQFTKKKSRCQRGGVRGVANQNATTERKNVANQTMLQGRSRGLA